MILDSEISPKYLVRRKESMLAFRRGLRLVSTRTAFGDASESDAESDSRRLYALRLKRFNAPQRHISAITAYI